MARITTSQVSNYGAELEAAANPGKFVPAFFAAHPESSGYWAAEQAFITERKRLAEPDT